MQTGKLQHLFVETNLAGVVALRSRIHYLLCVTTVEDVAASIAIPVDNPEKAVGVIIGKVVPVVQSDRFSQRPQDRKAIKPPFARVLRQIKIRALTYEEIGIPRMVPVDAFEVHIRTG